MKLDCRDRVNSYSLIGRTRMEGSPSDQGNVKYSTVCFFRLWTLFESSKVIASVHVEGQVDPFIGPERKSRQQNVTWTTGLFRAVATSQQTFYTQVLPKGWS